MAAAAPLTLNLSSVLASTQWKRQTRWPNKNRCPLRRSQRQRDDVQVVNSMRVLVTGASGRTGKIVIDKLAAREDFDSLGLVRSLEKKEQLLRDNASIKKENVYVGNICDKKSMAAAFESGIDALVILTSAVPIMIGSPQPGERPQFAFEDDGMPEQVDFEGQRNQIELALENNLKHVVLVGSRGGTQTDNMLNRISNRDGDFGNILVWKRKAEQFLVDSGMTYTIIRAGGLLDQEGGQRELVVGADDEDLGYRSIPRADVAEMCVASLLHCDVSANKSMDLVSKDPQEGNTSQSGDTFIELLSQCKTGM